MAALNQQETEALRNVTRLIDYVERNGYDPNDAEQKRQLGKALKDGKKLVNTVVQMKGYYPSS